MTQEQYNDIIACIKLGCPIKATELIDAFNTLIQAASKSYENIKQTEEQKDTETKGEE